MTGTPHDPRAGRQRRLARFLRVGAAATFVLAAAALFLPGEAGRMGGILVVVVLVAVPLVRLAWLGRRWLRKGDRRFALVAVLLGLIILAGSILGR